MTRAFQKPLGVLAYYWSEGDDSDLKLFENELSDRRVQYKTLNFSEEYLKEIALNGADAISDKYEKPLNFSGYGIVYPDFTFLSRKLRKEIYWEHEGMMDKPEYAIKAAKKLNSYQMNGILPGERLILTFETEQDVLNSKIVCDLVDKYLR